MRGVRSILVILACISSVFLFIIGYIVEIGALSLIGTGILAISLSFLFLSRENLVREDLVPNTFLPVMYSLSAVIDHFRIKGKGVYIPPMQTRKECKLIVLKDERVDTDRLKTSNFESKTFLFKDGIILTPTGESLLKLVEGDLGIVLASKELDSLAEILNKSLIEILKIAESVYVNIVGTKIFIQVFKSIFFDSCARIQVELPNICTQVCCPLCSLMACMIAKMTERSITVDESQINAKERSINVSFRYL